MEVPVGKAVNFFSQSSTSIKRLYSLSSSIRVCLKFLEHNQYINRNTNSGKVDIKESLIRFIKRLKFSNIIQAYLVSFCMVGFIIVFVLALCSCPSIITPTSIIFLGAFTVTA